MTNWRGMTVAALAIGAAAAPTVGAMAAQDGVVPPGQATAAAAKVKGVLGVSETAAVVSNDEATASASVVTVGGEPAVSATSGTQTGEGSQSGAFYDTGETPVGQAQVMPWSATVTEDGSTTEAQADASVLDLVLLDPAVLEVGVLTSSSTAAADEDSSSGAASTDGATVDAFDQLHVTVLHSEASSENGGTSYVLGLNDSTFITSDSTGGMCHLDLVDLVSLNCLTASGGEATGGIRDATAEVVSVTSPLPDVNAFTTTASAGPAAPTAPEEPETPRADDGDGSANNDDRTAVLGTTTSRGTTGRGGLATTGADVMAQVVTALALLGLGGCAMRSGRNPA